MRAVNVDNVLAQFKLTEAQRKAALTRGCDVAVTAGAGSGKTSTLVARYACLLADGIPMRSIVAITFTEKAAREMRSRVRQTLHTLAASEKDPESRKYWSDLHASMDSARISTIHSLCAEILRANPVEACVDPRFEVIDENHAAALRASILKNTLAELVGEAAFNPLFRILGGGGLEKLLEAMLAHRLEVNEVFAREQNIHDLVARLLREVVDSPAIAKPVSALREYTPAALLADAGDTLAAQVEGLLRVWGEAESTLARGETVAGAALFYEARRNWMDKRPGGKTSHVKASVAELRDAYDKLLNPICGGKNADPLPPDESLEDEYLKAWQALPAAFERLTSAYRQALVARQALDFDDLEGGAARLLQMPAIQKKWQQEFSALLVDEFQDTNERQRQIVAGLSGSRGVLFIVGDAKQSIYRFRRADVTVFRKVEAEIKAGGGEPISLDTTFRAHQPLLSGIGSLLESLMNCADLQTRLYEVPYAPMQAHRVSPPAHMHAPHVEFVLGAGKDAAEARPSAARALAYRLLELKREGQVTSWDDVTLLFRATGGYAAYETAFEDAAIPFVTVAGRGFYDRPEIRDLLNMLRALADPADDLAMAGLMRSPAFGLTDAALYQLRWQSDRAAEYWEALHTRSHLLGDGDAARAVRMVGILDDLKPQVDRVPVAELLKRLVDATDYRAALAIDEAGGVGSRLWRNLDKLLVDAQASGMVNVRDFLDYIETLNDAGAREGEAPAEALGAVRLMTIHKSKGLQFKVVVLADASRARTNMSSPALVLPEFGLAFKTDPASMHYRLAYAEDQHQVKAEENRLLYVALTRAEDKVIISGHATQPKGDPEVDGWMNSLLATPGVNLMDLAAAPGQALEVALPGGEPARVWMLPEGVEVVGDGSKASSAVEEVNLAPIYEPLPAVEPGKEPEKVVFTHRASRVATDHAARVVGSMVHRVIQYWCLDDAERVQGVIVLAAQEEGMLLPKAIRDATERAKLLLGRFRNHLLYEEMAAAAERYHEVPYARMIGERFESGYMDVLLRTLEGWQVVDFKTDAIHSEAELQGLVEKYRMQALRYASVAVSMLNQPVRARLCFLDAQGAVRVVDVG